MENQSNNIRDRLIFKSLIIPSWFGISTEDWLEIDSGIGDYLNLTVMDLVILKLLKTENSADYWLSAKSWPYPDKEFYEGLCAVIDGHSTAAISLGAKTFIFGFTIQHVRHYVMNELPYVYQSRLKQQ